MTWWLLPVAVCLVGAAAALTALVALGAELEATAVALDDLHHQLEPAADPLRDDARALAARLEALRPKAPEERR